MKPTQEQVIAWAREICGPKMPEWRDGTEMEWHEFHALALRCYEAGRKDEREKVAQWMIQRSYATGHGDTTEDLLAELEWQVREAGRKDENEACAKAVEAEAHMFETLAGAKSLANAIRARREQ